MCVHKNHNNTCAVVPQYDGYDVAPILGIFLYVAYKRLEMGTYVRSISRAPILFSENPKIPAVEREQETCTIIIPQREVNLRSREENLVVYKSSRFVFLV